MRQKGVFSDFVQIKDKIGILSVLVFLEQKGKLIDFVFQGQKDNLFFVPILSV